MEEPQRSIVQRNFDALVVGWEASLDRTRENLKLGSDPLDVVAAEGAFLYGQEGMSAENLAFFIGSIMVYEAGRTPRARGAKRAAVPAKRPRKQATLQDVKDARAVNAAVMDRLIEVDVKDYPGSEAISELTERRLKEAGDDVAAA